nr:TetR/AcrR family transcriptional regulator C-terminal domain-containing protein [Nonomuraea sp. FMUSA5-5]
MERIVSEAVALLDEEGVGRLTMRRLAERLDTGSTTLYWHVKTKDDVLDLALDEIFREVRLDDLTPPGGGRGVGRALGEGVSGGRGPGQGTSDGRGQGEGLSGGRGGEDIQGERVGRGGAVGGSRGPGASDGHGGEGAYREGVGRGRVVSEAVVGEEWRGPVRGLMRRWRGALLRHPWSATLLDRPLMGPHALERTEFLYESLTAAGFTAPKTAAYSLSNYVMGSVIMQVTWERSGGTDTGHFLRERADRYPALAEHGLEHDWDATFDEGLGYLLEGMARSRQ